MLESNKKLFLYRKFRPNWLVWQSVCMALAANGLVIKQDLFIINIRPRLHLRLVGLYFLRDHCQTKE
ncbi:hypothetical protein BLOT_006581 [Blomia tropicalis]|nr:hypothetical protein BLOT_006581 [Blomia tropicalis]